MYGLVSYTSVYASNIYILFWGCCQAESSYTRILIYCKMWRCVKEFWWYNTTRRNTRNDIILILESQGILKIALLSITSNLTFATVFGVGLLV